MIMKKLLLILTFFLITSPAQAITSQEIINETNKYREKHDLEPYTWNEDLEYAAQLKTQCIILHEHFAHEPIDYNGNIKCTVEKLLAHVDYNWNSYGENLAMGNWSTAEELVTAWYNSPGHQANLLNESHTEMGVGIMEDEAFLGSIADFYTQEFASPGTGDFSERELLRECVWGEFTEKPEPLERNWKTRLQYHLNKLMFWK